MIKCRALTFIVQHGKTIQPNGELYLTQNQVDRLEGKVEVVEQEQTTKETEIVEIDAVEETTPEPEVETEVVEEKPTPRKRTTKKDK